MLGDKVDGTTGNGYCLWGDKDDNMAAGENKERGMNDRREKRSERMFENAQKHD